MKLLICGESWGRQEEIAGHALVGASGRLMAKLLHQASLAPPVHTRYPTHADMIKHWARLRDQHGIGVTNVFPRHPDHDRIELFFDSKGNHNLPALRKGKYILPEFMPDLIRLHEEIQTLKPNLILAAGNSALWATAQLTGISTYRGAITSMPNLGFKILPTYHPAAVMRQMPLHVTVLKDLERAKDECAFPEIRRTERWITTLDPSSDGILCGYDWFQRAADTYTNDIETYGGLITMTGFARNPHDALVVQFADPDSPNGSFWPTPELEFHAWKLVQYGLRTGRALTFQNGLYDLSYYARMGLIPRNCKNDTMLRHHAKFPELPKALGFLGSIYAQECAWKPMRHGKATLKRDE